MNSLERTFVELQSVRHCYGIRYGRKSQRSTCRRNRFEYNRLFRIFERKRVYRIAQLIRIEELQDPAERYRREREYRDNTRKLIEAINEIGAQQ